MKRMLALAVFASLAALPAAASEDPLALLPPDATTVGSIRVADLRSNPFQLRLFQETDKIAADGDAALFLQDAGLNLREDVDVVVACTTSADGRPGQSIAFFEGRFDPARLSAAVVKRGAYHHTVKGGDYYRLKENGSSKHGPSAVAFLGPNLVLAGSEPAVVQTLARRAAGGRPFASGPGLGKDYHRVNPASTAWVLVDVNRWRPTRISMQENQTTSGLVSALKSVSLLTFEASVEGDALSIKGTGLSSDEETRGLLEDALRGMTAAWRLAAQEKHPDLVAAIRKIQISHDAEGVTMSGKVPGELLRSLSAEHAKRAGK